VIDPGSRRKTEGDAVMLQVEAGTTGRRLARCSVALAFGAVALLAAGCAGGADGGGRHDPIIERSATATTSSGTTTTTTGSGGGVTLDAIEVPDVAARDERLQIGMDATRKLNDFVSSDRTVMGERTVVDLSRTPFLGMSAFEVSTDDVERVERRDEARGLVIITMRNRTGVKTVYSALPKVRIGGLIFIGVEELELRYAMRADRKRPIFLQATAMGKAVYRTENPDSSQRGSRASLSMEIRGLGDAARFEESAGVSR
jgi:hypothetical protein